MLAVSVTRRRLLSLLGGLAAVLGLSAFWASRMRDYHGPVSDHFDGTRFFDPDGVPPKSLGEVLRWQFGTDRKRASWPDWVPNAHSDTPPPRVSGDKVRLSFVGHVTWLIQIEGTPTAAAAPASTPKTWRRVMGTGITRGGREQRTWGVIWRCRSNFEPAAKGSPFADLGDLQK